MNSRWGLANPGEDCREVPTKINEGIRRRNTAATLLKGSRYLNFQDFAAIIYQALGGENFEIGRVLHFRSEIPKYQIGLGFAFSADMTAKPKMAEQLQQRLVIFGARACRVAKALPRTQEGRYISKQLMRSALAGAPNYAEARAAESRADFIHKLRIVLKELNETETWLEQVVANGLFSREKLAKIIAENQELCWIIAASIKTARGLRSPI